jgi:hypothetical protein
VADERFAHYSTNDFDRYDCLKLSKRIYLPLIFILRGYFIWLLSVTDMNDKVSFLSWVFPQKNLFYFSLLSGVLGLFIVILIFQRKPDAPSWVKYFWPKLRLLLVFALLFDFFIQVIAYSAGYLDSVLWLISQGGLILFFIYFCFSSRRLTVNLTEFPRIIADN